MLNADLQTGADREADSRRDAVPWLGTWEASADSGDSGFQSYGTSPEDEEIEQKKCGGFQTPGL
jgi:hypothetical protein